MLWGPRCRRGPQSVLFVFCGVGRGVVCVGLGAGGGASASCGFVGRCDACCGEFFRCPTCGEGAFVGVGENGAGAGEGDGGVGKRVERVAPLVEVGGQRVDDAGTFCVCVVRFGVRVSLLVFAAPRPAAGRGAS